MNNQQQAISDDAGWAGFICGVLVTSFGFWVF